MINFFRKIRKQLADHNKPLKYFRYAVGEIVLVVIGILIALQINNWNEERKFRSSQRDLLEDLRSQIVNDTIGFSRQVHWFTELHDQMEKALYLLKNREQLSDSLEYNTISLAIGSASILMPLMTNVIYSESTMDKIDSDLNMKLIEYIQQTRHSYNVFQKLGESLQIMVTDKVYPLVDLDSHSSTLVSRIVHYDFDSIKSNRELNNVLHSSQIYRNGLIEDRLYQIGEAQGILEIIDELLTPL